MTETPASLVAKWREGARKREAETHRLTDGMYVTDQDTRRAGELLSEASVIHACADQLEASLRSLVERVEARAEEFFVRSEADAGKPVKVNYGERTGWQRALRAETSVPVQTEEGK